MTAPDELDLPLRLLLVADDAVNADAVVRMLAECLPTASVVVVEDLSGARQALGDTPDLVLADMSLPDQAALEVIAALRTSCPTMAVVVLCRSDDDDFVLHAISAGADDCLLKGTHDGQVLATVVVRSVHRVRAQAIRQRRERFAASLLDGTESPTCAVDLHGRVVSVNEPWRVFTAQNGGDPQSCGVGMNYLDTCDEAQGGHSEGAVEMAAGLRAVLDGDLARFEQEYPCHAPDRQRWFSVRVSPQPAGDGAVISHIDVTASRLAGQALSRQSFHDRVTGLPGAHLLADRLEQALAEGARSGTLVAVALVDVDQYAAVLQEQGTAVADELLVLAADRLADCVRDGDTLAQLSGARFVVVWREVRSGVDADELTGRLCRAFVEPFVLAGTVTAVTATVGAAVDQWAETGEELLLAAAAAMHDALRRGPGQVQLVTPPPDAPRPRTEAALREAMFRGELVVHYQPVVDLARGVVVGAEALVRWQHPTDGLLGPDSFIPVAESGGLIVALGARVLEQACEQAVRWQAAGLELHVAVNLSTRQVAHPDLLRTVQRALRESGLQPQDLVLEVTESAVMEDAEAAAAVLSAVADLGVGLSIDDFGTGYSSLVYLKRYPIRALKVDRTFVAGMGSAARDDAIVASVLALARAVGGLCIAEGVETIEQYTGLVEMGCEFGQGWLFGRAVPADELPALIERCELTMSQLRAATPIASPPPAPVRTDRRAQRDQAGDVRDEVADRRDDVAEKRDGVAERRDNVAERRDAVAERRDAVAERRDDVAGLRDDVAEERDDVAERRDNVAERRDNVAERRDAVAERRDAVAQERDHAGDARDQLGERRDLAGAQRDEAADLRDLVADQRDRAADQRDVAADNRDLEAERGSGHLNGAQLNGAQLNGAQLEGELSEAWRPVPLSVALGSPQDRLPFGALADGDGVPASAVPVPFSIWPRGGGFRPVDRSATARREAASDRVRASQDRHAGATERIQAKRDRGTALADRGTASVDRGTASVDRGTASDDRGTASVDRGTALADRGAGAGERVQAVLDRDMALADRDASARERAVASADEMTGSR